MWPGPWCASSQLLVEYLQSISRYPEGIFLQRCAITPPGVLRKVPPAPGIAWVFLVQASARSVFEQPWVRLTRVVCHCVFDCLLVGGTAVWFKKQSPQRGVGCLLHSYPAAEQPPSSLFCSTHLIRKCSGRRAAWIIDACPAMAVG